MNTHRTWLAAGFMMAVLTLVYLLAQRESGQTGASPKPVTPPTRISAPAPSEPPPEASPNRVGLHSDSVRRLATISWQEKVKAFDDSLEAALDAALAAACPPKPIAFVRNKWLRRPLRVRRYVGRIGSDSAMALLTWHHPDSIRGSFVLLPGGAEYFVTFTDKPRRPFRLYVNCFLDYDSHGICGTWQLTGKPGTAITGTWTEGSVRKKIMLREDYTDAVRCEILTLQLTGGRPESGGDSTCSIPSWSQDYLHLRENLAQRPALRRLQCPPEPVRRRQLLRQYERTGNGGRSITVRLNGFGLLSYNVWYEESPFCCRPQLDLEGRLFDLQTGKPLTIGSQLRPGYQPGLGRLLLRHLVRDINQDHEFLRRNKKDAHYPKDSLKLNEVLPDALLLTGAGLEANYFPDKLYVVLGPDIGVHSTPYTVLIPYSELRPLVRPGTPLARMLKARGMW